MDDDVSCIPITVINVCMSNLIVVASDCPSAPQQDQKEGMAAFIEKRPAVWRHR